MIDLREELATGTKLKFENGMEYEIRKLVGRGANCLVYDAIYYDSFETKHLVRVKELFPYFLPLKRHFSDAIVGNSHALKKFEEVRKNFAEAYRRNVEIGNTLGIVNTTSNAQYLLFANGTYYSICAFDEGEDYKNYQDNNLYETLKHVKALAEVIKKYHDNGYLHLDIKPENVLILPETKELIKLFDFDSVVRRDELLNGSVQMMSYSNGFSAPEQKRGDVQRIGPWSDIFSIGAVLYVKMFDKLPQSSMMQIGSTISLDNMQYEQTILSPVLTRLLKEFFGKTLMISSYARWKSVDDVIASLEKMIPLADPSATTVWDNFVYNEKCFVGRQEELTHIHNILSDKQAVFLSGIGGIGKTELAKRYAYRHREDYDTIVFLRYDGSIKNTIMSDNLCIYNFECVEQESDTDQYELKISALKKLLTSKDLIIVDNFDVDYDDELERLLEVGCRFIFTSREDFRDYNYEQIDVDRFSNVEDAQELFCRFNEIEYSEQERQAVDKLLLYIEYHTMLIVLLAKYLRDSGENPNCLYDKFCKLEGITNTGETKVKHRKDKLLRAQIVNKHLQSLFQVSNFTDKERQVISTFSLMGQVRIQKNIWLDMMDGYFTNNDIDQLIRRGWMEADSSSEDCKISLHQIILDLVYTQENLIEDWCGNSVEGYISFLEEKKNNPIDMRNKKRLANKLLERIQGKECNNLLIAKYYYAYCKYMKWNPKLLCKAENICQIKSSSDAKLLLCRIDILSIKMAGKSITLWDYEPEQIKEQMEKVYSKTFQRELKAFSHIREYEKVSENAMKQDILKEKNKTRTPMQSAFWNFIDYGEDKAGDITEKGYQLLLEVALALCASANNICDENVLMEEVKTLGIAAFYLDAEEILNYLEFYALNAEDCTLEFKKILLKRMIEFYDEDDCSRMVQGMCVGDAMKCACYTEQFEQLRNLSKDCSNTISLFGTSYMEAANQVMFYGDYCKAIALYKKALQNKESMFDDIMFRLCEAYLGADKIDEAEKGLLEIVDYDERNELDQCFAYRELVEIYKKKKEWEKVKEYCNLILENKNKNDLEGMKWNLVALIELIEMGQQGDGDWDKDVETYLGNLRIVVDSDEIDCHLVDSFERFWNQSMNPAYREECVKIFYNIATKYRMHYCISEAKRIYRCLINCDCVKNRHSSIYIRSVLWSAEMFITSYEDDYDIASQLLFECDHLDYSVDPCREYYNAKTTKLKKELVDGGYELTVEMHSVDYDTSCNYYLITKTELAEKAHLDEDKFQLWIDTANEYIEMKDTSKVLECLEEIQDNLQYCVLSTDTKKYVETSLKIAGLLDEDTGTRIQDNVLAYIESKRYVTWDEQREVLMCFALNATRVGFIMSAIDVFLKKLYVDVTGGAYEEFSTQSVTDDKTGKCDFSLFMSESVEYDKIHEIITSTEWFLAEICECEMYQDYYAGLEEVKLFYEQLGVEFKDWR